MRETPGEGFPLALRAIHRSYFVTSACAMRTQRGFSLSPESDQRRRGSLHANF